MSDLKVTPGPGAQSAFRLGMGAAAVAGLAAVGLLYWTAVLTPLLVGFVLLLVFPIYLVFAASALSVWLGFGKDATDLRPVYREKREKTP
ncbi:hypothetical protein ACFQE8_17060 [Salinirubellus sp. GCM10025818]|jgi:hypothetical protein|uniref:hypothetical protein n=1 Tax=Salinirubellus TaxID=2162630 RepID=UPI0030D00119